MIGTLAVAALLLASSPLERQSPVRPRVEPLPTQVTAPPLFQGRTSPFVEIFPARPTPRQQAEDRIAARTDEVRTKPRVVCGMMIIEGDPKMDPKIAWGARGAMVANPDPKIAWPVRQCTDK